MVNRRQPPRTSFCELISLIFVSFFAIDESPTVETERKRAKDKFRSERMRLSQFEKESQLDLLAGEEGVNHSGASAPSETNWQNTFRSIKLT
jgi:hypothetical protein